MSRTFWIIIAVAAAVVLLILLFAAIPKIKSSLQSMNGWLFILLILLVAALGIFAAFKLFGPAGNDSVLSENVDGDEKGDADADTDLDKDRRDDGTDFTEEKATEGNAEGDSTVYVTVRGSRIYIGQTAFSDAEQFQRAMQSLKLEDREVCLVDNYAKAVTYREAKEILDGAGVRYSETASDDDPNVLIKKQEQKEQSEEKERSEQETGQVPEQSLKEAPVRASEYKTGCAPGDKSDFTEEMAENCREDGV